MALAGHEDCDYSTFDTKTLNRAIAAIADALAEPLAVFRIADVTFGLWSQSGDAMDVTRRLDNLVVYVKELLNTRECIMHEIMNRAYVDNKQYDAMKGCACGSKLPTWECELLKNHDV